MQREYLPDPRYFSSASSDKYARITSSRLFSEISPWPKPRPSSSRALRIRGIVPDLFGAPTITAGRVITTPLGVGCGVRGLTGIGDDCGRVGVGARPRSGSVLAPLPRAAGIPDDTGGDGGGGGDAAGAAGTTPG